MRILVLPGLVLFPYFSIYSQIAGPNSGSGFASIAIAGSNKSWTNTGNAAVSDNSYTSYGTLMGGSPSFTDYLQVTDFGFSLPGSITINGIVAEVERSDPSQRTADYRIRIVKGGVIGATERSSGAAYPSGDAYQTYGNSGDLWGETWTETDINSTGFGVAIAAVRTVGGANSGRVDHIRITVYYDFISLPVKLNNFSAVKNRNAIDLSWIANDESNMSHYEVERSLDGSNFITLNKIPGLNQSATTSYSSTDIQPSRGINYYRLKMVENSGRITYSKIVSVHFSSGNSILLYPNPWQNGSVLNITNATGDEIRTDFYSLAGNLLGTSVSAGRTVFTGPLLHTKGLVFYKLTNKDGNITGKGILQVY